MSRSYEARLSGSRDSGLTDKSRLTPPNPHLSSGNIEEVIKGLRSALGDSILETRIDNKIIKVSVKSEALREAARHLKEAGFDHVKGVTGVDLIALTPSENAIEVMYHAGSYLDEGLKGYVLTLATKLPRGRPETESLTDIWPSSDHHERETYEMLGVIFKGHPNLRRFLLPEWWADIPPLRKDYKPPGRE